MAPKMSRPHSETLHGCMVFYACRWNADNSSSRDEWLLTDRFTALDLQELLILTPRTSMVFLEASNTVK